MDYTEALRTGAANNGPVEVEFPIEHPLAGKPMGYMHADGKVYLSRKWED